MVEWRIAGHQIAVTNEGSYLDFPYLRCLQCPGCPPSGCNHILWMGPEDPVYSEDGEQLSDYEPKKMLEAVLKHLRSRGVDVPADAVAAARTISAFGGKWDAGISTLRDSLSGPGEQPGL